MRDSSERPARGASARAWRLGAAAMATCIALASVSIGCRKASKPAVRSDAGRGSAPLRGKPRSATELATTSGDLWLENLSSQIEELERISAARPEGPHLVRLASLVHTRGRVLGDVDDLARAVDLVTRAIALSPADGALYLARGEQAQSLHRFREARADLEKAKSLGADRARIADLEGELDWNDGRYEAAVAAIERAKTERPSTATWLRAAQLAHDLGREADADLAFERAEDRIRDTSPLVLAHLNLQRGIQKSQLGKLEEAVVFFREAVARLPAYVGAREHLAEALAELGRDDEAVRLYEDIGKRSRDPEFAHALAELYARKGRSDEARRLDAQARAGYEALLVKYAEAMYWHASEFFLDVGEPARAVDLLRKNVALRPNATSYVALARAEHAAGHGPEARAAIDKALKMPLVSADLFSTAAEIYDGEVALAATYRARANAIDPRRGAPSAAPKAHR